MGLQDYFDNFATQPSRWAHPDSARCACGAGWFNSELDTWHECPYHHFQVDGKLPPHPESEGGEDFNWDAYRVFCRRDAFRFYRGAAISAAKATGDELDAERFAALVVAELPVAPETATPDVWVTAARVVADSWVADAERFAYEEADAAARANGYSCALEARWTRGL